MGDREFDVGGVHYRCGAMGVFEQNHVARKFGSVLIFLGSSREEGVPAPTPASYARAMVAMTSPLSQEDVDYVLSRCLATVKRQDSNAWAALTDPGGTLMYKLDLAELMEIVWHVLDANGLIAFFYAAPSGSPAPVVASS